MKKLLNFLQSNQAVLIGAILALTTQLWHSVRAFVLLDVGGADNKWNYLFGILFSISTSFAILLFTVRGRKGWAYFFLAVEVFINLIHYSVLDMPPGPILFATIFMCLIVPVTISIYSSEIDVNEKKIPIAELNEKWQHQVKDGVMSNFTIAHNGPEAGKVKPQIDAKGQKLLQEINDTAKCDIMDDKNNVIPESKKAQLRELWRQRNDMPEEILKAKVRNILKEKDKPLFQ